ncbi:hypothetical protein TNCV_2135491 [Trichonephila clavipes]|nr:hypothetical protein TNCV_2135491 [Trichonephila clavipes]
MLSQPVYFAYAYVFHHQGKPIKLSIATIPRDGRDPHVMGITVSHAGITPQELRSTNVFVWYTPLYTLPKFNDDGTFPNSLHEKVHVSYGTLVKSYQFVKYLQQFNKLQVNGAFQFCKKKPGKRGIESSCPPSLGSNSIPRLDRSANLP